MKLKLSSRVQTRDGRKARIICVDAKGYYPVIALVEDGGAEWPRLYTESGHYHNVLAVAVGLDLIPITPKRKVKAK